VPITDSIKIRAIVSSHGGSKRERKNRKCRVDKGSMEGPQPVWTARGTCTTEAVAGALT